MSLNWSKIESDARRLHETAKDGTAEIGGVVWTLKFDRYHGVYECTAPGIDDAPRFNTRKITVAKKWLREYLAN
jgi:hypothetical protein